MKPFAALVPAILLLACLALPCTALESKVLTVIGEDSFRGSWSEL